MGGHHSQFTEEQLKDYQVKQRQLSSSNVSSYFVSLLSFMEIAYERNHIHELRLYIEIKLALIIAVNSNLSNCL